MAMPGHAGWRSRGYLPHCDGATLVQHVVFGQADAIAPGASFDSDDQLDMGVGSCVLRDPACATIVEDVLLHADAERYRLIAWCVMPNHVHVVFQQLAGWKLATVVQAWKSASSHIIGKRPGAPGVLWRREYFDRFMRDDGHLQATIRYVEENPVKAGLVVDVTAWPFSSATRRAQANRD
jgi:putative transposase